MTKLRFVILLIVISLMSGGVYTLLNERRGVQKRATELRETLKKINTENQSLQKDIEYYGYEENLLKEAKAQFNYRAPGEKLFILIGEATSTE